ncbi:MAG: O-methyltransferase [Propionicimonas sp.]|uniref:O-methyltransferase n=1 Tax=Propionicimonas sp. TaxID=1955623 RepID=UPI002B2090EB|nr:O-methyltransferase [Propionicimonas sp.]MEA4944251.1 O-methyltransferase [Propionicimonas sp.]MEA5116000.1 O-methyltransferase [Propionicimonas sp.]
MSPTPKPAAAPAVAAANLNFAEAFTTESAAALAARAKAADLGVPAISSGTAAVLTFLTATLKARSAVEVGTGTGVSAVALLAGMAPEGVLTSIDNEPELQFEARAVLTDAGIPQRRARLIAGEALTVLPKLTDGAYDLVFLNGDPLEYVEYVDQAVPLLRPGGILVLHHALWQGKVADAGNEEDEPIIIREALDAITALDGFATALLPIGDGLVISVRP